MKALVTLLALAVLMAALLTDAQAGDQARKPRHVAQQHHRYSSPAVTPKRHYPQPDEWYERLADKLPIGSFAWWDQMRREGRVNR